MSTDIRSVVNILRDVALNIEDIVRSELRLAKTEVREEFVKARASAVFLGIGALGVTFSAFFLLLTIFYSLSTLVPKWAAALIVAAASALVGSVLLDAGLKRLKQVHLAPKTVDSLKEDFGWARPQVK